MWLVSESTIFDHFLTRRESIKALPSLLKVDPINLPHLEHCITSSNLKSGRIISDVSSSEPGRISLYHHPTYPAAQHALIFFPPTINHLTPSCLHSDI